jgi:hypothetical protein
MYSRTSNENGSLNSRCLYCFMKVATELEATVELDQVEAGHLCPEKALAHLLMRKHSFDIQLQAK